MTTTISPEDKAIEARRASAQVRQTAGRLARSCAIMEQRAEVMTSAERRAILARAAGVIVDAARVRQDAERTIPPTAPAVYLVSIRAETSSLMASASLAIRKVAGGAYADLYTTPIKLAVAVLDDLATMGGTKPKTKDTRVWVTSDDGEVVAEITNNPAKSKAMKPKLLVADLSVLKTKSADGKPLVRVTASSDVEDLEQDVFELSALKEMRDQFVGRLIFLNHNYKVPVDVFGVVQASALHKRGDNTFLDLDVGVETNNPAAVTTYAMIADGTRLGVSVGVLVRDATRRQDEKGHMIDGFSIRHVTALEASIVGIPANQTAWVQGTKRLTGAALREARESMALS